jgi:hypothetical protein
LLQNLLLNNPELTGEHERGLQMYCTTLMEVISGEQLEQGDLRNLF